MTGGANGSDDLRHPDRQARLQVQQGGPRLGGGRGAARDHPAGHLDPATRSCPTSRGSSHDGARWSTHRPSAAARAGRSRRRSRTGEVPLAWSLARVVVLVPLRRDRDGLAEDERRSTQTTGAVRARRATGSTCRNYVTAFTDGQMAAAFVNTAFILVGLGRRHDPHRLDGRLRHRPLRLPRSRSWCMGLFLLATLVPGVTTQVATFQVVNELGLFNTRWAPIAALHWAPTSSRSTSSCSSSAASPARSTRRPCSTAPTASRSTGGSSCRCSNRRSPPSSIIKGVAIYNDFYIPFLYMPLARPRRHLDVAVPLQGPLRRALGGHLGRRRSSSSSRR